MQGNPYDLIIVGLGAMGAAALWQAAQRGARVLGIDRHDPPHRLGSSHGDTRITRLAIGEGEMYMPFIQRANAIWRDTEARTGQTLFHQSGGLVMSPRHGAAKFHADGDFAAISASIAGKYGIRHEILNTAQIRARFPLLKPRDGDRAYYEPDSGVLRPERCIASQLRLARDAGADTRVNEPILRWHADANGASVATDHASYRADKLILAAGAWMTELLQDEWRGGLRVCRQVIHWFEAEDLRQFAPDVFPWVIWIGDKPDDFWSAFPAPLDGLAGLKVLGEQYHRSAPVDAISREVTNDEIADMARRTQRRLRGTGKRSVHAEVCSYTVTRDEHFVVDFHPASRRVVLASPCSGHGFKHSAAIGESLAQMALDGAAELDVSGFALARL